MTNTFLVDSEKLPFMMYFQETDTNPVIVDGSYDEDNQVWISNVSAITGTTRGTSKPTNNSTSNHTSRNTHNFTHTDHGSDSDNDHDTDWDHDNNPDWDHDVDYD